ncbi:MAG TPA: DNA repair protein RecO [Pyrinomonadaceae bacterium]|jgi:DNA repair protein RecO (recombination protein O)
MALVETEGLVLKSYGLAEADKIVVFLTREHGLVRGVAKGAKRLKSKFGGSLEPFSIVRLTFFQKEDRELVSIQQSEIIRSFFELAVQPNAFQKFAYLVELLNDFAPPSDPNERLYRMAKVCLEASDANPEMLSQMILYFELWLLKLGGYLPSWERCDICKRELEGGEKANLQINFHLACLQCRKTRGEWTIPAEQREIFSFAQKVSPTRFLELTRDSGVEVNEVSNILKRIISNVLGRESTGEKILVTGN